MENKVVKTLHSNTHLFLNIPETLKSSFDFVRELLWMCTLAEENLPRSVDEAGKVEVLHAIITVWWAG